MPSLRLFNKPLMEVNPSKMAQLIISSSVRKGGQDQFLKKSDLYFKLFEPIPPRPAS